MSLARVFAPVALAAVLAAGCGPKTVYGLSSDDNNAERLGAALAKRAVAKADAPLNALGKPLVFAAVGGAKKQLVAFDAGACALVVEQRDTATGFVIGRLLYRLG